MSEIFKKAKEHFNSRLPFVVYCKPNSDKTIALFQKNDDLFELDSTSQSGFAFVSFNNLKRYLIPDNYCEVYFENNNATDFIISSNIENSYTEIDKVNFEKLVQKGVDSINNNQFEKVVLSRKESVELQNFDFENAFKKLVSYYNEALKYCFYHPKIGLWIGATPEQFLKIEEDKLKTVSLAGTQLSIDNQEVIWSKKEIIEQKIVTDYLVYNLSKFSDSVEFSEPYTIKAGTLSHIKTDIEAKISDKNDISKIINLLHPTPAVCGFPKQEAKDFIIENEGYDREFYSGFLGEWKKDFLTYRENQSDLFVNLRCMKIEIALNLAITQAKIFIGCGITKDSSAKNEFVETVNKSITMKKAL
ncbi:chorismate-binding protein [Flavobacterium sp.]|uniref:chorismate-binding protein n=1 Tax=Flavobacterium sp. TaxID=239 RepID=UPI003750F5A8